MVPKLLAAPAELREAMVQVFSDPASHYVLGRAPMLLSSRCSS